jgi:hypothetical protein
MSYDNKTNRELAKTALAIYAKHSVPQNDGRSNCNISSLNENVNYNSAPRRTPQNLKEAISDVLLEFSSDVVLLSEHSIGRQLNSNEINNVAGRLLEYINILPPKQQVSLMQELTTLYEGDYLHIPDEALSTGPLHRPIGHPTGGGVVAGHTKPGASLSSGVLGAAGHPTGGGFTDEREPGKLSAAVSANTQIHSPYGLPRDPYTGGIVMHPENSPEQVARVTDTARAISGQGRRQPVPIGRTDTKARRKRRG